MSSTIVDKPAGIFQKEFADDSAELCGKGARAQWWALNVGTSMAGC